MKLLEIIEYLRGQWTSPRDVIVGGEILPFKLRCTFESSGEHCANVQNVYASLPRDLTDFWCATKSARLFEDASLGQWGLEILPPNVAICLTDEQRQARPLDFLSGDFIIGKFIGDSELLLIRCNPQASDYGTILVVAPLDPRPDWSIAATSFSDFLDQYVAAQGDKYWELRADKSMA